MKQGSTGILKGVIFLIGIAVLALCIFVLPTGIRTDQTGGYGPILLGMYVSALPFFIALFHGWKLTDYIDQNKAFSDLSVTALKNIKYCGFAISAMYALGMPYIFTVADKDDAPGVVAIGLIIIFASFVIAVFAEVLRRLLQSAIEIKSENDLTV